MTTKHPNSRPGSSRHMSSNTGLGALSSPRYHPGHAPGNLSLVLSRGHVAGDGSRVRLPTLRLRGNRNESLDRDAKDRWDRAPKTAPAGRRASRAANGFVTLAVVQNTVARPGVG